MAYSLDDVAARAGVSSSTVSRALRGLPVVSESTRVRIVAIAEELGYVVSPSASRLASGRTGTVGVVVPHLDRWYYGQALRGIERGLRAAGYDLLLYNLGDGDGRRRFFEQMPLRRRVDAVVAALPAVGPEIRRLADLAIPVVGLGFHADPFAGVRIDDAAGAARAVRHLVNLGHRDVALIGGGEADGTVAADRRRAYREVLASAGLVPDPGLEAMADFTAAGGQRAMAELLTRSRLPTAVFAAGDEMAFGALRTLRLAGLRVPGDVSVVGFDDHELAPVLDLTTVAQPVAELGAAAVELLLQETRHGPRGGRVLLDTALVVRGSTAPPA